MILFDSSFKTTPESGVPVRLSRRLLLDVEEVLSSGIEDFSAKGIGSNSIWSVFCSSTAMDGIRST